MSTCRNSEGAFTKGMLCNHVHILVDVAAMIVITPLLRNELDKKATSTKSSQ